MDMVFAYSQKINKIGPWPEWTSWGGEDNVLWNRVNNAGLEVWRGKFEQLVHQWHPKRRDYYEHPDRWHWDKSSEK